MLVADKLVEVVVVVVKTEPLTLGTVFHWLITVIMYAMASSLKTAPSDNVFCLTFAFSLLFFFKSATHFYFRLHLLPSHLASTKS